jgi:hypothetical protein
MTVNRVQDAYVRYLDAMAIPSSRRQVWDLFFKGQVRLSKIYQD